MKKFTEKIKEKGNRNPITTHYVGSDLATKETVEDFYGVHNDDVEWYEIYEE